MGVPVFMSSPHFYVFLEVKPPKNFQLGDGVRERADPGAGPAPASNEARLITSGHKLSPLQVGLMVQGGGLQGLPRRLERHFMRRQSSEFFIREGEQLVGSLGIAALKRLEDARDFGHAETTSKTSGATKVGKRAPM